MLVFHFHRYKSESEKEGSCVNLRSNQTYRQTKARASQELVNLSFRVEECQRRSVPTEETSANSFYAAVWEDDLALPMKKRL